MAGSSSRLTEKSDDCWKSYLTSSSVEDLAKDDNGSIAKAEHLELRKVGAESSGEDSIELENSQSASSKSVKRNKWKPEEIMKLIKMRGELNSRFQVVKGRMVLWEEISANLLSYGINRTPAQCKSLWASLIQKYEVHSLLS